MGQKRAKIAPADQLATTLRAARIFVGDAVSDDTPVSVEEVRVAAEFRKQLPRPTSAEIAEIAKKIA
jgi:hypothetical protein